jgi:hypothetical protein
MTGTVAGIALLLVGSSGVAFRAVGQLLAREASASRRWPIATRTRPVLVWRGWWVLEGALIGAGLAAIIGTEVL